MRLVRHHIVSLFILCCLCLLLISCSSRFPIVEKLAPLPERGVCRVAVLPFDNQSDYRDGDILFYRVFTSELAGNTNFILATEGDIRQALRQIRKNLGYQKLSFDQMRIIGDYLKADVLISGAIVKMGEVSPRHMKEEKVPFMTVSLRLFDVTTGRTIMTTYHTRSGEEFRKVMHFGLISTTTQLADQVSKEIIGRWDSEGLIAQCTE